VPRGDAVVDRHGLVFPSSPQNSRGLRWRCNVFERFNDEAVMAVIDAQNEVLSRELAEVTSHELMLAILKKDSTNTARILQESYGVKRTNYLDTLENLHPGIRSNPQAGNVPTGGGGGVWNPLKSVGELGKGGGGSSDKKRTTTDVPFSDGVKRVFQRAAVVSKDMGLSQIGTELMILGMLREEDANTRTLETLGVDFEKLKGDLERGSRSDLATVGAGESVEIPTLDKCSVDLTELAKTGELDPVVGREKEVDRALQILVRRMKNNPCLIGEPGVGKTAIAEGLAQLIVAGKVPPRLAGKRIVSLDLASVVAGTKYRGEFEERFKAILDEVKKAGDIILFIDEIHTIVGSGAAADGSIDGANLLKPALARGKIQVIGATTIDEYKKNIEKDKALERRFQPVMVEEATIPQTIEILKGVRSKYEDHHGVMFSDECLDAAAAFSHRYIRDRFLPDKAIDLIDEAGSLLQFQMAKMSLMDQPISSGGGGAVAAPATTLDEPAASAEVPMVTPEEIARVVALWTGIPVESVDEDESEKLMNLEENLADRVIGQRQPVISIAKAIRRSRMGLKDPSRPVASFIFSGPTGVGKTELAKALADTYFGSEDNIIRLDMSEYMERFATSRMIGSPPGYVGFDDGGQLTEAVRRKPHSLILFDEIEKAHPDVFNILLQILDDGRLTDSKGRTVDFTNTLIIMTSNVGSSSILEASGHDAIVQQQQEEEQEEEMETNPDGPTNNSRGSRFAALKGKEKEEQKTTTTQEDPILTSLRAQIEELKRENADLKGKQVVEEVAINSDSAEHEGQGDASAEARYQDIKSRVFGELQQRFRPEFLNRLDEVIVFRPLDKAEVRLICDLMLADTHKKMQARNITLSVTDKFKDHLVSEGFDPIYGARPLRRAVKRCLEDSLAERLLSGDILEGQAVEVDVGQQGDLLCKLPSVDDPSCIRYQLLVSGAPVTMR